MPEVKIYVSIRILGFCVFQVLRYISKKTQISYFCLTAQCSGSGNPEMLADSTATLTVFRGQQNCPAEESGQQNIW